MAINENTQMQQDMDLIEANIKLLEKQYEDFLVGVISREPKPLLSQTEALVRKWWGRPIANTQLKFRIQNLVQRFNSYKEKWNRQIIAKAKAEKEDFEE